MTEGRQRVDSVSVVVTCHNEAPFVGAAIKSVLDQTDSRRIGEVIVVDDGSTDASPDIINRLARDDPKVRYVRLEGNGVSAARNHAISLATGTYIAFLDGDDLWAPNKLEVQLPLLEADPSIGLVYADYDEFDSHQPDVIEHCYPRRYLRDHKNLLADYFVYDGPVMPSTMIARKSVLDEVDGFNPEFRVCEDTDICLRIAERYAFHHVPQALLKKRRHEGSLSNRQDRLWDNHVRITALFSRRNPVLSPLAHKRLSLRAAKVAWGMIEIGERRQMVSYLWRAFRYNPVNTRIYLYLALGFLPESLVQRTHQGIKTLRRGVT